MKKLLIAIIITSILLTGCWDQVLIEKTGIILMQADEISDQNKLLMTNVIPVIGIEKKNKVQSISVITDNPRDSRELGRHMASLALTGGKMQELLFSDKLAEKGIHDLLEVYERDPADPLLAYVVVVDGSPKELIDKTSDFEDRPILPIYVHDLLEQNIEKSQLPDTRIYKYDIDYFADGIDSVTPLIKLQGDDIVAKGSALFAQDKMVGKIDTRQTVLLESMMGEFKPTDYTFKDAAFDSNNTIDSPRSGLDLLIKKAKPKIDISIENNIPVINIALDFKGNISEFKWDDLDTDAEQSKIEKVMTKEINQESNELIKYMQSVGSDPVGFGNMIRAQYNSYWNGIKWQDVYKKATITVTATVTYEQNGAIK